MIGTVIWRYGMNDQATKSDCIIVLGAGVRGSTPSPVFEQRIRHGINLYTAGYAAKILFTGGLGEDKNQSESSVARSFALLHGVPATDILIEEKSRTTQQNLSEALAVMRQNGLNSAIIVSDPLHMRRSMMIASHVGMRAVSSPTPTSQYRSLKAKLGFLFREMYFIQNNFLFRE